jgi:hypothetical protein
LCELYSHRSSQCSESESLDVFMWRHRFNHRQWRGGYSPMATIETGDYSRIRSGTTPTTWPSQIEDLQRWNQHFTWLHTLPHTNSREHLQSTCKSYLGYFVWSSTCCLQISRTEIFSREGRIRARFYDSPEAENRWMQTRAPACAIL